MSQGSKNALTLLASVKYLDIREKDFIREMYVMCYYSNGGITYDNVLDMDINRYIITLEEALRIQSLFNRPEEEEEYYE